MAERFRCNGLRRHWLSARQQHNCRKGFETEQACKDGAQEIDMVVNIGKVLGKDWDYVEQEIAAI